jgi:hypothetical protein
VTLRTIAHSRAGDKGRIVNISLIAYELRDYSRIERHVTADRVREHFAGLIDGNVTRYELPQLGALNFVFRRPAGDSVTQSLAMDAHGKTLSSALLEMEIPDR